MTVEAWIVWLVIYLMFLRLYISPERKSPMPIAPATDKIERVPPTRTAVLYRVMDLLEKAEKSANRNAYGNNDADSALAYAKIAMVWVEVVRTFDLQREPVET